MTVAAVTVVNEQWVKGQRATLVKTLAMLLMMMMARRTRRHVLCTQRSLPVGGPPRI
jgi:hypothetical protein